MITVDYYIPPPRSPLPSGKSADLRRRLILTNLILHLPPPPWGFVMLKKCPGNCQGPKPAGFSRKRIEIHLSDLMALPASQALSCKLPGLAKCQAGIMPGPTQ